MTTNTTKTEPAASDDLGPEDLSPEACPGCGCLPGDGLTDGCEDPMGCGYNRQRERETEKK